jgi:hypothetical protein
MQTKPLKYNLTVTLQIWGYVLNIRDFLQIEKLNFKQIYFYFI